MRVSIILLSALPFVLSCKSASSSKIAQAAVVTGVAVAAAGVNRALTDECWGACRHGMRCDKSTGMCETLPCRGACASGQACERVGGIETCVGGPVPEPQQGLPPPVASDDPCQGLCFANERCVMRGEVADCERNEPNRP